MIVHTTLFHSIHSIQWTIHRLVFHIVGKYQELADRFVHCKRFVYRCFRICLQLNIYDLWSQSPALDLWLDRNLGDWLNRLTTDQHCWIGNFCHSLRCWKSCWGSIRHLIWSSEERHCTCLCIHSQNNCLEMDNLIADDPCSWRVFVGTQNKISHSRF